MSPVAIIFPEPAIYYEEIEIPAAITNRGSHLGFEQAPILIADCQPRFFHHYGFSDMDVGGAGIIVAGLSVRYKAEIFAGERLRMEVAVGNAEAKGCDIYYRFLKLRDGRPAVMAKTEIVFFDYGSRKSVDMPALFRQRFFDGENR
jgi:acyl-CoA thioesterase FadM